MVNLQVLKIFRIPNLIIVAIIQSLLFFLILKPTLSTNGIIPLLSDMHFILLVMVTVIITASGYVINDLSDIETDRINKPERLFVGNIISFEGATRLYYAMVALGFVLATYLSIQIEKLTWLSLYPISILILWTYSKVLKKTAIIGNVLVSIYCAGVPGVLLFAEQSGINKLVHTESYKYCVWVFIAYMLFSFLTTLLRELIKDIEDLEGDKLTGIKTLPVIIGVNNSRHVAAVIHVSLIICIGLWCFWSYNLDFNYRLFGIILVIFIPSVYLLKLILQAQQKKDYSKISQTLKIIMFGGILLLPLYHTL